MQLRSTTPSASVAAPGASASAEPAASDGGEASAEATPALTAIPGTGSAAKPGDVEIRWYCCLGTGDAPEQVEVEEKVAEDFNASHPGIHLRFEGYPYQLARDALSVQIGSGAGPDIVGPVGIGGAEAFHGQWLDLQPLIDKTGYDMSQYPASTVSLYNVGGEGQAGIPFAIYPSALFYKASLFKEAGLNEPPHEWNCDLHDARRLDRAVGLRHGPQDRPDPDRRLERQGRDRGRVRPREDRPVGLRATARRPAPGRRLLEGRHSSWSSDGKTVQIPEAWAAAWHYFYDGIWKDHISVTGPAVPQHRLQSRWLPVLHREGRDERELPVVDLRRQRRR